MVGLDVVVLGYGMDDGLKVNVVLWFAEGVLSVRFSFSSCLDFSLLFFLAPMVFVGKIKRTGWFLASEWESGGRVCRGCWMNIWKGSRGSWM